MEVSEIVDNMRKIILEVDCETPNQIRNSNTSRKYVVSHRLLYYYIFILSLHRSHMLHIG